MIYDPKQNYLFIHIQKTGGTSITDYLVNHFGGVFVSPPHLPLRALRFTQNRPFVFASVRNPWERLVSWYEMMKRKGVHNDFSRYLLERRSGSSEWPSFSEFIRRTAVVTETNDHENKWTEVDGLKRERRFRYAKSLSFNQIDYLVDEHEHPSYNEVLRFETLETDLLALVQKRQLGGTPARLKRLNINPDREDWRRYFDDAADRDWVERLYHRDITQFGFSFEA